MQGLLGKVVSVTPKTDGVVDVRFKAIAVLPSRGKIPDWLKDKTLSATRTVSTIEEIGGPGDSVVFGAQASARWLRPLTISPDVVHGNPPEAIEIRLAWWHEDNPPDLVASASGRRIPITLVRTGDAFTASLTTTDFRGAVGFPQQIVVEGGGLKASCAIIAPVTPAAQAVDLPGCAGYRLSTAWYAVDVSTQYHTGSVFSIREWARPLDHFEGPVDQILHPCDPVGQYDRVSYEWGFSDAPREQAAECAGVRKEDRAIKLTLDAVADPGRELKTSVSYSSYEDLPLLTVRRDYSLHRKADEKDDGKPREAIDSLGSISLAQRSATLAERDGIRSSRVLLYDGSRLVTARGNACEILRSRSWLLKSGWAVAEHPGRKSTLLYLFDTENPPTLHVWNGPQEISVEPCWNAAPAGPGQSVGFTSGLIAGELAGASEDGAWVGVRAKGVNGGVQFGIVARIAAGTGEAVVTAGGREQRLSLTPYHISGLGTVLYAVADFPECDPLAPIDAEVAGITRTPGCAGPNHIPARSQS